MIKRTTYIIPLFLIIISCTENRYDPERSFENIQQTLLTQFILTEDSTVIELPAGHFIFDKSLILDGKHNIKIKGQGIDKTVLSFKDQKQGAEGIRIANCTDIVLEDFSIEDAPGDNIKVTDTDGITFRRVKSAWTGEVSAKNGAYGLYPVLCKNVMIEECEVMGASDAGIYVGQSEQVIIRNNIVYWNVAGIESENSSHVIIHDNKAYNNTGGILVFDLPGLTRYGNDIKVYGNEIIENNMENFAPAGNIVGVVPKGTGVLVLATEDVEVFNNVINNNKTIGVAIVSYELVAALDSGDGEGTEAGTSRTVNNNYKTDTLYNPYPRRIFVHSNNISSSYWLPALDNDFGKLFIYNFGFSLPSVAWDGIRAPEYYVDGSINPLYKICIDEGENVITTDLDAANDFENLTKNPALFLCEL